MGVRGVGIPPGVGSFDPLGTCWECHVFGCKGHGERDGGAGKWLCHSTIHAGLAVSAGIDDRSLTAIRFVDSEDFQERVPQLAAATTKYRTYWRSGEGEGRLGGYLEQADLRETRWDLLCDALGVGFFLLSRGPSGALDEPVKHEPPIAQVLSPKLAAIVGQLTHG
jgi:hypothetical protein